MPRPTELGMVIVGCVAVIACGCDRSPPRESVSLLAGDGAEGFREVRGVEKKSERMKLDRESIAKNGSTIKRIIGDDDLHPVPVNAPATGIAPVAGQPLSLAGQNEMVRAIGWMPVSEDAPSESGCTVFGVAPRVALTAGHCFGDELEIRDRPCDGTIHWGPRATSDDEIGRSRCSRIVAAVRRAATGEDFAVLELGSPAPAVLAIETAAPEPGAPLQVLGYADGEALKYSEAGCSAAAKGALPLSTLHVPWIIGYACDTKTGSSGGPVLRTDRTPWRVVAIHNTGSEAWNWGTSLHKVPLGGAAPSVQ
jgi:hypothetical protein